MANMNRAPKTDVLRGRAKIAITNHCRLASETMHPRFLASGPGYAYSTILTVNSGYE